MTAHEPDNRDLSQLSALLAAATGAPTPVKPKKPVPVAANDNKRAPDVLAWPTLERLAYRGDEMRVYALRHWRNMLYPGSGYVPPEPTDDDTDEAQVEIRPSEAELLRAIGWTVTGTERWERTGKLVNTYAPQDADPVTSRNRSCGEDTQLGDLLFRDGKLVEWGRTKKGTALRPIERTRGVKGSNNSARSDAAIWSYLRLPGAVASPLTAKPHSRPLSGEPAIGNFRAPLPREAPSGKDKYGRFGVKEAREALQELGIDGSVPFDCLPFPATRCPDALVPGPQWVGGVKKPKPLGEISAAAGREPETLRLVEMTDYLTYLRRLLGKHAEVLDLAIGDSTANEIGIAMGQAPAYAEKRGPSLIDAAIDALINLDETARVETAPVEEKIAA